MLGSGSSPQARGARREAIAQAEKDRLIPAGAGSTSRGTPSIWRPRAHPRRRGEHSWPEMPSPPKCGSSPQARGAQLHRRWQGPQEGLIPAGAGSTMTGSSQTGRATAHPRRRGEHFPSAAACAVPAGSSPQARGALADTFMIRGGLRLIPAGAGSTRTWAMPRRSRRAHPRRRGEHQAEGCREGAHQGSSPQARGARGAPPDRPRDPGLIPAGAGSTAVSAGEELGVGAHPRRRGEHRGAREAGDGVKGSSPQARGALHTPLRGPTTRGLIPAGAGSTKHHGDGDEGDPAHPRRRGEHPCRTK